jgi:hypothetical protein
MKPDCIPEHTRHVLNLVPGFAEFLTNLEVMNKSGMKIIATRLIESCSVDALNAGRDLLAEAVKLEEGRE